MSIARRIATGSVANLAGVGISALLQLLTVPVLASAWGPERFGLWMMLTTIPTYFALTDLGFAQAATTDMTIKAARQEHESVLATFQSVGLLFVASSATVFALSTLLLMPGILSDAQSEYWMIQNAGIIVLLTGYSALALVSQVTLAGFRATGNYAVGTLVYDSLVLVEGLAALLIAFLGGDFRAVAITFIVMRLFGLAIHYSYLRVRVPWLYLGFGHANFEELKRLLAPALAAMMIPVALAINLQGVVLLVGIVLSPASVALLAPVRTASRVIIQVIGVVNRATMPELGRAFGANAEVAISKLLKLNLLMVLVMLVPGGIAFAVFGAQFVTWWSGGHIVPPKSFVEIMALSMVIHGCWYFGSNVLLATNSHTALAKYILGSSIVSLILLVVFAQRFGLVGSAIALALSELINVIAVFQVILRRRNIKIA
ncbi:O-antigen/teichoic acid export membrane protein [Rhizobium aquaticum]|uniref:O-antigen/teichoic acid export membrane protein n=1 Tax=Rhizobium aquaticum TaxID=1549636 RepID=A0ABV2J2F2_9HYPH